MPETFNYIPETQDKQERLETNQTNLSFSDIESNIKKYYDTNSTIPWADNLALKQYQTLQETNQLKESKENQIQQETKEELDKEAFKNEMKIFLYEKLWIDNDINNNSSIENFIKWVIDWWVLDNYDLLVQIYETNWKIILDWIKQLLTWKWLKKLAESLKQDLWTLWKWNAYEKWKVSAEVVLWLITAWAWVTVSLVKKWIKEWIKLTTKQIAKLRVNKERLVNNSKVKQVVWETKNKVNKIVPKQEIDLKEIDKQLQKKLKENWKKEKTTKLENKYTNLSPDEILKLKPKERLKAAEEILSRNLSKEQKDAILEAHNIWERLENWNYSIWDLKKKVEILQKAWFDNQEVRILLDKWICWKEYPKFKSLYEDPKYSFLEKYREYFWDIDRNDIIWEWNNAIILNHPTRKDKVVKISKDWKVDDLEQEYFNHMKFYETIRKWHLEWKVPSNIQIWKISEFMKNEKWIYVMDRIEWQSLYTWHYKERYEEKLTLYSKKTWIDIDKLTDNQFIDLLDKLKLDRVYWFDWWWDIWEKYNQKLLWSYYRGIIMRDDIQQWLKYLKERWLEHTDLHPKNIMVKFEWDIPVFYIIDFARVNIK